MTNLPSVVSIQSTLSPYHPLLVEGYGPTRDVRDPAIVARRIVSSIRRNWNERNVTKPPILITQGDPTAESGIGAITRIVANELGARRCLVFLDEHIDSDHSRLADRHDVDYELRYSQLLDILNEIEITTDDSGCDADDEEVVVDGGESRNEARWIIGRKLTDAIDDKISLKNDKRRSLGEESLADCCRNFALLQEVTKAALKQILGEITVAHTTTHIEEFSVTSFYNVGLELGLIDESDMVYYSDGQ